MKRTNEPVFWLLFASGGMTAAMVLPAVLIVLIFLLPTNLTDAGAFSYSRISELSNGWFGSLIWFLVITLPMWHALHRILHLTQDLKFGFKPFFSWLLYGFACAVTVATLTLLFVI